MRRGAPPLDFRVNHAKDLARELAAGECKAQTIGQHLISENIEQNNRRGRCFSHCGPSWENGSVREQALKAMDGTSVLRQMTYTCSISSSSCYDTPRFTWTVRGFRRSIKRASTVASSPTSTTIESRCVLQVDCLRSHATLAAYPL